MRAVPERMVKKLVKNRPTGSAYCPSAGKTKTTKRKKKTIKAEIEYDLGDTTIISKTSGISVYLKENNDYINIYDANRF